VELECLGIINLKPPHHSLSLSVCLFGSYRLTLFYRASGRIEAHTQGGGQKRSRQVERMTAKSLAIVHPPTAELE